MTTIIESRLLIDSYFHIIEFDDLLFQSLGFYQLKGGDNLLDIIPKHFIEIFKLLIRTDDEFVLHLKNDKSRIVKLFAKSKHYNNNIEISLQQIHLFLDVDIDNSLLQSILNHTAEYIAVFDVDGLIISMNKYPTGYSPDQIRGKLFFDFIHEEDRERVKRYFENVKKNTKPEIFEYKTLPNRYYIGQILKTEIQEKERVIVISFEITELVNTRKELNIISKKYRDLLELAPLGITISSKGKLHYANQFFADLLERTPYELKSLTTDQVVGNAKAPTLRSRADKRLQGENLPQDYEMEIITKSGDRIPVLHQVRVTEVEGEKMALSYIRDLRREKLLEEQQINLLQQIGHNSRLESMGIMASSLAHELNNHLVGIMGNASILEATDSNTDHLDIINSILKASQDASNMIKQILDISGNRKYKLELEDINILIDELKPIIQSLNSNGTQIKYNLCNESFYVKCNSTQIKQILINYITNSLDATDKNGKINVSTSITKIEPDFRFENYVFGEVFEGDYFQLSVEDNGSGISGEVLTKIFNPFFTTKDQGQGLGLAIVFGIVKAHRGFIQIKSSTRGTKVNTFLPLISLDQKNVDKVVKDNQNHSIGKILIIDDQLPVLVTTKAMVGTFSSEVLTTNTREEALTLLQEKEISHVISDLSMPGQMDFEEFLKKAVKINPDIRVVVISGYLELGLDNFLANKNYSFLAKPYTISMLKDKILSLT